MTAPGQTRKGAGRTGARIVACTSALVVLALAYAFFGLTMARMPFAAITLAGVAAAALYAYLMWRAFAARSGLPTLTGALVAGAGAPLVGAFLLDMLQSLVAGDGGWVSGSILLAFWPVAVVAVLAGAAGGLLALALGRRRLGRP